MTARTQKQIKVGVKPYGDHTWYTIEHLKDGEWKDMGIEDDSLKWAKRELVEENCYGRKCVIVKHVAKSEIVCVRDFRPKTH